MLTGKGLRVTIILYLRQVHLSANTRCVVQSWKSQVSDTENPSYRENQAKPKEQKQTQLRETRDSAEKAWPKLDVKSQTNSFIRFL
jgi:hypothetical protein